MKLRKPLSLLLSVAMMTGMASFAASAATKDENTTVSAGSYYNGSYLESYASKAYNEKDLGSTYSTGSTTWKTWSPDATAVKLKLFSTGSDSEPGATSKGTYDLTKNASTGVWSTTLTGDYKNMYYTYLVTVNGKTNETQDVYSKATGVNGTRSMVVDLKSTDPDGWNTDKHVLFNSASEAVVWEVHVRDFSASSTSGVSKDNQGKYLAFTEGGTKLNSDSSASSVSTGIDYLVKQGINCVQLMPVYDFQSVDEKSASSSSNRNWGYDPMNYNVPEGSYSSNAFDGNTRITEFKQMIQALHDRNISVVMDVVYNHTYTTEGSCLSKTVPGYYYRKTSSSKYSNGSGCGNETASDKLMYRKYMIESIVYWAQEYHIDGFRFDLMGIHDITTMNDIRSALDNLYSDGSGKKILMYGEPWTGGTVAISDGCSQAKASSLDSRVGMFCDSYRDSIKGGTDDASKGFVQGNTDKTGGVVNGVKGKGFSAKAPSQTIAYADAHDNLIMWDKIVKSNNSTNWSSTSSTYKGQMKEIFGLILTSQGIPFATAGSEFCRTKQGDSNSYKSNDSINAIDWSRVQKYSDVSDYYKGLLQIRNNYSAMTSSSFKTPSFQSDYGYVVAYTYTNSVAGEWNKVCVLVNSGSQAFSISLGSSNWTIVANDSKAGLTSLGTVSGSSYSVPAKSTAVLVDSASFNNLKNAEPKYGTLTVNHVDKSGKTLKTSTATYAEGSTYRAIPDSTILFDNDLVSTSGNVSGKVVANQNNTVTFTYAPSGVNSGYLTVKCVDESGKSLKADSSYRLKEGEDYQIPYTSIQGYQLDTEKYPVKSYGKFEGQDKTLTFVYKPLDTTTTKVHYYNSNNWSSIRCYAYTDDGENPNGDWDTAKTMQSDGNKWYSITINAPSCYVMFHPASGTGQEPGQGESGYPASGEVWIENKTVTFGSKVVTSHIDVNTGKKITADVIDEQTKTTSDKTYKTSPLSGRDDVILPVNATGNYIAGVVNVVYLYGLSSEPTTTSPDTSVAPTTVPDTTVAPTTQVVTDPQPTTPSVKVLIGDVDLNNKITIQDASLLQKYLAETATLSDTALVAADSDGNGVVNVKDVSYIQKYLAEYSDTAKVGQYVTIGGDEPTTTPVVTTVAPTQPVTEPVTQPATEPEKTYTLYFKTNLGWMTSDDVSLFAYDKSTGTSYAFEQDLDAYPNVYLAQVPESFSDCTVYRALEEVTSTPVVEEDGSGNAFNMWDATVSQSKNCITLSNDEQASVGAYVEETKPEFELDRVYFDNSNTKWSKVYIYGWAESGLANTAVEMTKIDGTNIYYYDFNSALQPGASCFLFKDTETTWVNQTVNITVEDGKNCYKSNAGNKSGGTWYSYSK